MSSRSSPQTTRGRILTSPKLLSWFRFRFEASDSIYPISLVDNSGYNNRFFFISFVASKNIAETLKGFVSIHFKYFDAINPLL